MAGKEVPRPSHLTSVFQRDIQPFLVLAKAKTWSTFVCNTLDLDVELENSKLLFGPNEYERGGFSGLKEVEFEISVDSTHEEIGQAIEKGLSLCIGKGGKRLEDFVAKNKELPSS